MLSRPASKEVAVDLGAERRCGQESCPVAKIAAPTASDSTAPTRRLTGLVPSPYSYAGLRMRPSIVRASTRMVPGSSSTGTVQIRPTTRGRLGPVTTNQVTRESRARGVVRSGVDPGVGPIDVGSALSIGHGRRAYSRHRREARELRLLPARRPHTVAKTVAQGQWRVPTRRRSARTCRGGSHV